ncbi:MAG TPA: hypothetical protein VF916_14690, partial [Ktedonobacterales bacterium]
QKVHPGANILFGTVEDANCEGSLKVTLVATGFEPRVSHAAVRRARVSDPEPAAQQVYGAGAPTADVVAGASAGRALPPYHAEISAVPPAHPSRGRGGMAPAQGYLPRAEEPAVDAWVAPRAAHAPREPEWSRLPASDEPATAPTLPDELDAPRVGSPRLRPERQAAGPPARRAETGFSGIDLAALWQRRR